MLLQDDAALGLCQPLPLQSARHNERLAYARPGEPVRSASTSRERSEVSHSLLRRATWIGRGSPVNACILGTYSHVPQLPNLARLLLR